MARLLDLVGKQRYRTSVRSSSAPHIVVMETHAPDGSKLEKNISKAYMDNIRSRTSKNLPNMRPNLGAYGA